MRQTAQETRIGNIVEPVVRDRGLELVCLQFRREQRGWVLRVFVERTEEGGVTLDDCERLSRELSDVLDVEDPIDLPYRLEVSSPGPERPLARREHFQRFLGRRARIQLQQPRYGRRNFTGILQAADDDTVSIAGDWGELKIPFEEIERANLAADDNHFTPNRQRRGRTSKR